MNEYLLVLCRRLLNVRFVSGESSLKVDAIHRMTAVLSCPLELDQAAVKQVCEIMRIFIIDWDRTVRSSAFRCLRYCLIRAPPLERLCKQGSLDFLAISRLESCKSSVERAAVLRFLSVWLSVTTDKRIETLVLSSLVELLVASGATAPNSGVLSGFAVTILSVIVEVADRSPVAIMEHLDLLLDFAQSFTDTISLSRVLGVVLRMVWRGYIRRVPEQLISPDLFVRLSKSFAGAAVLGRSIDGSFLTSESIQQALLDDDTIHPRVFSLIEPFKEELIERFITTKKFHLLQLFKSVDVSSIEWKFPDWLKERVEASSTSGSTSRRPLSRQSSLSAAPIVDLMGPSAVITRANKTFTDALQLVQGVTSFESKREKLISMVENLYANPHSNVLVELILIELCKLLLYSSQDQRADLARIAHLPGLDSTVLWLLAFMHEPEQVSIAIASGWLKSEWTNVWSGILMETLASVSMECDIDLNRRGLPVGQAPVWVVNGISYRACTARRPISDQNNIQKTIRDVYMISDLSLPHWMVIMDVPLVAEDGKFTIISSNGKTTNLDITDPIIVTQIMNKCFKLYGTDVSEISIGQFTFILEATERAEYQLLAIAGRVDINNCVHAERLPWETICPTAVLSTTQEGCDWLRANKFKELESSVANIRSNNIGVTTQSMWLVGGLIMSGSEHAKTLADELGVHQVIKQILLGEISCQQPAVVFTAARIAEIANQRLGYDLFPTPSLVALTFNRPAVYIPDIPELPPLKRSSVAAETFTESHIEILNEIDTLASSVHFKQKSASLMARKQKQGSLFLSIPLWCAVMERMQLGRFSLQARRVVHSLFIHTLCEEASIEILDTIRSQSSR